MTLATGTKLGPYEILGALGAGGMGEVYRAKDGRLGRIVAIKVLPSSFAADHERLQRFAQEARSAAALNHPNILSIFDIGDGQSGSPYVVSELLEGETLRDRLRNGPLPTRKAVEYALQTARGLAAAHEKGIVHRDLKPENLFVTEDNRVKILDFGLAKLTAPESNGHGADAPTVQAVTEPGLIMGTVGYMAPEQVRGKPADQRSDIFAFGAILYEMVSGKRAFHGETAADTMSAILKEDVPELSETARNVPPGLDRIVRHCLEKSPTQRFQSTGDLAFDLESLTEVSSAASKSGVQAAAKQAVAESSRRKVLQISGAVVAALLVGALGWWLGSRGRATTIPEYQQVTFRTGYIDNARFTPDGSIVYQASWDGSERQLYMARTQENGARELGLKNADLLAISKNGELAVRLNTVNLTGYAAIGTMARVPLSGGSPREILDNVQDADWGPDGEQMAVVRLDPATSHWRLEYPAGKVLLDRINWISQPKISPDGKLIAFGDHETPNGDDRGGIAVVDLKGKVRQLTAGWASVEGVVWSPSGNEVWFSASNSGSATNLRGVTLDGKVRTITNVPGGMWLQDRFNDMGLMITHQIRIGIRGIEPGGKQERELGWLGWSGMRDMTPDGKYILFDEQGDGGGPNYSVFMRNTDGSPPVRIGEGLGLALSADARWAITQPAKGGPLSLVPTGAGVARVLTHDNVSYSGAKFLPDGKRLLAVGIEPSHGTRDYFIDLNDGNSKPATPEGIVGLSVSPDGHNIVVRNSDGKWALCPLDGGDSRVIPGVDTSYGITSWAPDGASLYARKNTNREVMVQMYKVNIATGKVDPWKSFGPNLQSGVMAVSSPRFSRDGTGYAYIYVQDVAQAYVMRGLK
ncbi:MAG TPA: protein kinase [Terriglobales bacterium]|nr:protein kinase [Terriglobales bacterium]